MRELISLSNKAVSPWMEIPLMYALHGQRDANSGIRQASKTVTRGA